jgi:hypothetical protein
MKNFTKTNQNPEKTISDAFDSVNLINNLIIEEITDNKKNAVDRNIKHLELMLTKEFFTEALTITQKNEIETCILVGKEYIG